MSQGTRRKCARRTRVAEGRRNRRVGRSAGGAAGLAAALVILALSGPAGADETEIPRTPSPEGAEVYFIDPTDGDRVSSPFTVRFGLAGMGVAPAGQGGDTTGHHHLVIDAPTPPADRPVPSDAHHRHFGGGQTEAVVELDPGRHTLQLVLGDRNHVPHLPPVVSERITITVVPEGEEP